MGMSQRAGTADEWGAVFQRDPELLSNDALEERLVFAARHYHSEEANVARFLLEADTRGLHRRRGFSSLGDYALELTGIAARKAQYLAYIARRLKSLPRLSRAFEAGALEWTKAREIVRVATPATELEWLAKSELSHRELVKEVRRFEGREDGNGGEFATLTISLPVELLEVWTDCYELAERVSGCELEKFQVLEPMMAEFMATYLGSEPDGCGRLPAVGDESESESEIPPDVRAAVLERDGYECIVPGCSMRKMLDLHHLKFRSRGGSHDPANIVCICRVHHALIHREICKLTGTVGVDLTFVRPRLFSEKPPPVETAFATSTSVSDEASARDARDETPVGHQRGPAVEAQPELATDRGTELGPGPEPDRAAEPSPALRTMGLSDARSDGPHDERRRVVTSDKVSWSVEQKRERERRLERRAARRRRDTLLRASRGLPRDARALAPAHTCAPGGDGGADGGGGRGG